MGILDRPLGVRLGRHLSLNQMKNSHSIVAVILAVGVSITVIILAVETVLHTGSISEQESALLSTVLGAAIGAVATYLGLSKANGSKDE
jgi:uncharacterized membrane protein AbrB (regulator of aidB expression)